MRRSKKTARRRRPAKYSASDAPLILQSINPTIRRNLQSYSVYTSNASGTIDTYTDICTALTASSDWTNLSGAYLAMRLRKVHIEIIPFVKMYASASTTYYGNSAVGYSPSTYANPTTYYAVLNNACSIWAISNTKHQLSFEPQIKSGAKGPIDVTLWSGGAIAGSVLVYGSNSYPTSSSIFAIRYVFECEFVNPG